MWAAGSLYSAGVDTTVSAIHTFFLAMLLYPEVQAKAQVKIDEIVGRDRMPAFGDKDKLFYCSGVVKETLRWHPVGPLAIPHTSSEDDMYEGYTIPKGSTIIANVWATCISRLYILRLMSSCLNAFLRRKTTPQPVWKT